MVKINALSGSTLESLVNQFPNLRDSNFLQFLALRGRSLFAIDLLANLASSGKAQSTDEYLGNFKTLTTNLTAAIAFATSYGLVSSDSSAESSSASVFDFVLAKKRGFRLTRLQRDYYCSILIKHRRYEQLRYIASKQSIFSDSRGLLGLSADYGLEPGKWCTNFSAFLGGLAKDIEPLTPGPRAFFNLKSKINIEQVHGGSLVSVVMTIYQPTPEVFHAIDSILAQTYQNFELIVVDDGSGPTYRSMLDQIQVRDPRIRILALESNVGTYGARNAGWLHANGRYVTGQDSDDWSHPRRLELQVSSLDNHPELMGNWCGGLRVSSDLELTLGDGSSPVRRGHLSIQASMMIRQSPTLLTLGFFDSSRKGADTEYLERIKTMSGANGFREVPETLYVTQARSSSLSRSDFGPGWKHINRQVYATAYSRWHRRLAKTPGESAFMSLAATRPFPAPHTYRSKADQKSDRRFGLIVLGDWYSPSIWQETLLDRVNIALAAGDSVGFSHIQSCFTVSASPGRVSEEIFSLYEAGQADFVALDDVGVQVRSLLTADEYLIFADPQLSTVSAENVTLLTRKDTLKDIQDFGIDIANRMFPNAEKKLEEV